MEENNKDVVEETTEKVVEKKEQPRDEKGKFTSKKKIKDCRDYLNKKMEQSDAPIYGINTGFAENLFTCFVIVEIRLDNGG